MLPAVEALLKAVVERVVGAEEPPTFYDLEALTQAALKDLTAAQGHPGATRPSWTRWGSGAAGGATSPPGATPRPASCSGGS